MHNAAYRGTNEAFVRAHIDSPFVILRRSDRKHRASFVDLKESLKDQHSRLSQPLELLMEQFTALQQRCSETDVALENTRSRLTALERLNTESKQKITDELDAMISRLEESERAATSRLQELTLARYSF